MKAAFFDKRKMTVRQNKNKTILKLLFLLAFLLITGQINAVSREGRGTADYILDQAFHHYYNNDYEKAIPFFEKHLEIYGSNEVSYRYLATIHYHKQNYEKCVELLEKSTKLYPDSVTSLNILAYAYLALNNVDKSIETHKKILEVDVFNENSLSVLATIYVNIKDNRTAAGYYKRLIIAVKKKSHDPNLLYRAYSFLGDYYYNTGNYSKSVTYFENLVELSYSDIESLFVLSELYKMTGNFEKSADILEHTIRLYPEYKAAYESLAEVYYIMGSLKARSLVLAYFSNHKKPAEHFKGMLNELNSAYDEAELNFRKSAAENQNRLSQYIGLYKVYKKTNNMKEAKKSAYTAALLFQKLGDYELSKRYSYHVIDILNEEANELNFQKEFFTEKSPHPFVFHEHIENLAHDYIETYLLNAATYESAADYRGAAAYFNQAAFYINKLSDWYKWQKNSLTLENKNNENESLIKKIDEKLTFLTEKKYGILTGLSWSLQSKPIENYTDALNKLNYAISMKPDYPQAYFILGIVYYTLAEKDKVSYAEPEKYFLKSIDLAKKVFGNDKIPSGYYFYLGIIQDKNGHFDDAVTNLKTAIAKEPYNSTYLNYLGYIYSLKSTKLTEARNLIIRALEDEPENDAYLDSLGWIFYKMEKYEEALSQLLLAVHESHKKGRKDPVIHYHLAETYNKLKNSFQAHYHYTKTLEYIEHASEKLDIKYIEKQIKFLSEKK